MIEAEIKEYKDSSFNLFKELKKIEANYDNLVEVSSQLENDLGNKIKGLENELGVMKTNMFGIMVANSIMTKQIKFFKLKYHFQTPEVKNKSAAEYFRSSSDLRAQVGQDPNIREMEMQVLFDEIHDLKFEIDAAKQNFLNGISISQQKLPQKLRATFNNLIALLKSSKSSFHRDQIIKLLDALNVSKWKDFYV
ncbi:unnamed protein product [Diamesa serratosioi]